jgi:tripartite-type tricarboxylate transporter receptor subunit TctC
VPELPTVAEPGFPGFDASSWFGLVGPAGLPRGSTPQEFAAYMRAETAKWAQLVKASGATVD